MILSDDSLVKGKTLLCILSSGQHRRPIYQRMYELGVKLIMVNGAKREWIKPFVSHWILNDVSGSLDKVKASVDRFLDQHPDIVIDGITTLDDFGILAAGTECVCARRPCVALVGSFFSLSVLSDRVWG